MRAEGVAAGGRVFGAPSPVQGGHAEGPVRPPEGEARGQLRPRTAADAAQPRARPAVASPPRARFYEFFLKNII